MAATASNPGMTRRMSLLLAAPGVILAQAKKKIDKGPPLELTLVKEFVGAGHNDLDKVKAMVEKQPGLLRAAWDWGGGDFETALGGAAHMGNRPIAEYLIGKGAPMDLFAAAMLGRLDVVKATIDAFPQSLTTRGPHGITLLVHARKGGPEAEAVVRYLESKA